MKRFFQRFKEPSTWAGISAIAALFGVNLQTPTAQAIGGAVSTLAGLAAIVLPEAAAVQVAAQAFKSIATKDQ